MQNALRLLNSFKLILIILVNLARFLDTIFFAFLRIFSYYINSYSQCFIYLGLSLLLYVSGLQVDFYILLTTLFMSLFIGLLVIFVTLYNTITFIYRFSSAIVIFLLRVISEYRAYTVCIQVFHQRVRAMEQTNIWAKRAHLRDTHNSGNIKSETPPQTKVDVSGLLSQHRESQQHAVNYPANSYSLPV